MMMSEISMENNNIKLHNMKKLFALIAILGFAGLAHAGEKALQIEFRNGTKAVYSLSKQPVVTFAGSDFTIKTADAETSYPRADVNNFTFVEGESGVADIENTTRYSYIDGVFSCQGHAIEVYDLSGRRVATGSDAVSLRELNDGVYVIRANSQSIKVVK